MRRRTAFLAAIVVAAAMPLGLGATAWADEALVPGVDAPTPTVAPEVAPEPEVTTAEPEPEPIVDPAEPIADSAEPVEPAPAPAVEPVPAADAPHADLAAGAIAPGATTEIAFAVENATSVRAVVVSAPELRVVLVAPWGQTWSSNGPETTKYLQASLGSPSTGTWALRMTNSGPEPVLASYETSFTRADVDLRFSTSVAAPHILLNVYPLVNGSERTDLAPMARITGPSGTVVEQAMSAQTTGSTAYFTVFSGIEPGTYTARVWVFIDGIEHSATAVVRAVAAETIPPTVAATTTPAANAYGWFRRDVQVRLVSTDNPGGSGAFSTYYRLDGGETVTRYSSDVTVTITGDGEHELQYWAGDAQQNTSEPRTATYRIDTVAPVITIASPVDAGEYAVGQEIAADFVCEDERSGIRDCIGTGADGEPIDTSEPGEFAFTVTALDYAGNVTAHTAHYRVAHAPTAPEVDVTLPEPTASGWFTDDVEFALEATDVNEDVASIHWRFVGDESRPDGSATGATGRDILTESGVHTVEYWAVDEAGNESEPRRFTVQLDRDAPTITIESPGGVLERGSVVTAEFACEDELSGVEACVGPTESGERLSTDTIGEHRFTVEATDAAGNVSERTVSYTVIATPAGAGLPRTGAEPWAASAIALLLLGAGATLLVGRRVARR